MFGTYRTFLALLVVAQHIGGTPVIGGYAVFGFYILSGYLMTYIMHESYGYTRRGAGKYALNRFLRLYPIYWVSIALSLALVLTLGSDFTSAYHRALALPATITDVAKNVLLVFPNHFSVRLTPPAWALTVEIFYYILIGLGLSRYRPIVVIWFALSLLYHLIAIIFGFSWEDRYFAIYAASLPFSTGAAIYHFRTGLIERLHCLKITRWSYFPHLLIAVSGLNYLAGYLRSDLKGLHFLVNYGLCALTILVLSETRKLPLLSREWDKALGDLSYPIYLIHYQVGLIVLVAASAAGWTLDRPGVTLLLLSLPLIILLGWAITVALERPIEAIRSRIKNTLSRPGR